jgi:hypothetical protein
MFEVFEDTILRGVRGKARGRLTGQVPGTLPITYLFNTHASSRRESRQEASNFARFPPTCSINSSVERLTAYQRNALPPSARWSSANPLG